MLGLGLRRTCCALGPVAGSLAACRSPPLRHRGGKWGAREAAPHLRLELITTKVRQTYNHNNQNDAVIVTVSQVYFLWPPESS